MMPDTTDANARAHVTPRLLIPVADPELSYSTPPLSIITSFPVFTIHTPPQSRKEKRDKKRTQKYNSAQPTPATTDNESSPPLSKKPPNHPPKVKNRPDPAIGCETTLLTTMRPTIPLQKSYPLLIASIGNPGPTYSNTLHSAGHIVTSHLATKKNYRPFTKGFSGLISQPDTSHYSFSVIGGYTKVRDGAAPPPEDEDWTFWQSTSLMNISGIALKRAYTQWVQTKSLKREEARLVVVHDELESELGKVTVKLGAASAKGHNGIKSCQQQLGSMKWWRVGVGIGRPESRDPQVVSRYVLGKMSGGQRKALEGSALAVFEALEAIASGEK